MSAAVRVKEFIPAPPLVITHSRTLEPWSSSAAVYASPDLVQVADKVLNLAEAESLYMDLVSASLAVVTQGKVAFERTFKVFTAVQVDIGDGRMLHPESISALRAWLAHVLGIRPLPKERGHA